MLKRRRNFSPTFYSKKRIMPIGFDFEKVRDERKEASNQPQDY